VQTAERLDRVVEELRRSDAIGVDLEMGQRVVRLPGGRQEWKHILALIQVASDTVSVLIDPLRCGDLSPLAPIMKGPTRKVFLGGDKILRCCNAMGYRHTQSSTSAK
jgi:ribonuclease D